MTEAQKYLKQVKLYDTHIDNKVQELDRLKGVATKVTTSLSLVPGSGSGSQDKLGDAVAKIIDLQAEVNQAIDVYVDKKREVCNLIGKIQDPDQLAVLHKRYIQYKHWEQIACEMGYTYRNVCYIHGRALQAIKELMKEGATNEHGTV